jgi:integrase
MAYAEKREGKLTGVWIGEVYRKPKTFRRRFKTKKDAEGYELYVKLTGEEPPTLENTQSTGAPTFAEAVEMAKAMKGPRGVWDLTNDESLCQRLDFVRQHLGPYEVTQMGEETTDVLKGKLDKIRKGNKPIKDSTKNRYLTVMSAVLHCCEIKKWIPVKPTVRLYRETNALRAILANEAQDEVILRLIREAGHPVAAKCVEFLVETGLRRGELCGHGRRNKKPLQPSQITIEPDDETGEENGWVTLGGGLEGIEQTKNNTSRRVYVRAALAKEMKAILLSGHLPTGDQLLDIFKSARDRAGYPSNLVIHSLRHTRNTRLSKVEPDIKNRMQILGQKTVSTNLRYTHVFDKDQLAVAKKLEKRAGDLSEKTSAQVLDFAKKAV